MAKVRDVAKVKATAEVPVRDKVSVRDRVLVVKGNKVVLAIRDKVLIVQDGSAAIVEEVRLLHGGAVWCYAVAVVMDRVSVSNRLCPMRMRIVRREIVDSGFVRAYLLV